MRNAKPAMRRISIDAGRLLGVSATGRLVGTEKQGIEKDGCKEQSGKSCGNK